jgi:hypothetical protein
MIMMIKTKNMSVSSFSWRLFTVYVISSNIFIYISDEKSMICFSHATQIFDFSIDNEA